MVIMIELYHQVNTMGVKLKDRKIAVLYGGISGERDVSLRSGKRVYDSIISQGLSAVLVDTKEDFVSKLKNEGIDLACIMLHGTGGEDGSIQGLLETLGVKYTGSGVLASALGMDKIASKRIWQSLNIPTPKYYVIDSRKDVTLQCEKLAKVFPFPLVIKPVAEGSSLGVTILKDDSKLKETVEDTVKRFKNLFIEEFIDGCQTTVGILENKGVPEALPVLELNPKASFYDFDAKYTKGMTEFIIPARLHKLIYENVQKTALEAFKSIDCRGFARIDIIVDKDGTPFVHDANTIPGMTDLSDLPAQAQAAGISYDELVLRILESGL